MRASTCTDTHRRTVLRRRPTHCWPSTWLAWTPRSSSYCQLPLPLPQSQIWAGCPPPPAIWGQSEHRPKLLRDYRKELSSAGAASPVDSKLRQPTLVGQGKSPPETAGTAESWLRKGPGLQSGHASPGTAASIIQCLFCALSSFELDLCNC